MVRITARCVAQAMREGGQGMNANRVGRHRMYKTVAMGGTFDVLHNGHKQLLQKAFAVGQTVMIGISSDQFARSLHKPHKVDPYSKRRVDLERLLKRWNVLSRAVIVPLQDRYGPTVNGSTIDALIVSRRTLKAGEQINSRRIAKGLRPLEIVPIDLLLAQDRRPISSTRIRRGKIDRRGRLVQPSIRRIPRKRKPFNCS